MKAITHSMIKNAVTQREAFDWVREAFVNKKNFMLPPKISIHYGDGDFFNTMPCVSEIEGLAGVKIISRHAARKPILGSKIILSDPKSGDDLALLEGDYITALRTGAVAALAIETLAVENYNRLGLLGLGNTAYATFDVLMHCKKNSSAPLEVMLLRYKDQAEKFVERFKHFSNVRFSIVDGIEEIAEASQVLVSCVTEAKTIFCDADRYPRGVLIVPVHTKGFQNCDLVFDRIYADDTGHVSNFKHFAEFSKRNFGELSDVLNGRLDGRTNERERILSYNIGIAIHDLYFAKKIYDRLKDDCIDVDLESPKEKIFY